MSPIALLLLLMIQFEPVDHFPFLLPLSDRERFPDAGIVTQQLQQWKIHVDRLTYLSRTNPGAHFDAWIAETKRCVRYWELLSLVDDGEFGEEFHRQRLADMEQLIGPEAYRAGWKPWIIDPEKIGPKPVERMAGDNGA